MCVRTHYERAPIIQALIDVQVGGGPPLDLALLAALPPEIGANFAVPAPIYVSNATIPLSSTGSPAFETFHVGHAFSGRENHKYALQARRDGLTVSRLAPYETWEKMRDEFLRVWDWYEGVVRPTNILRLGIRYTNRFDLPLPCGDFREFLLTTPEIGRSLPSALSGFAMQLQIPQAEIPGLIIVNEALVPPAREGVSSVILDIDVIQTADIPYNYVSRLEVLHEQENRFFEGSITEKARGLIR